MLSLDKKILDKKSAAAKRMVEYGKIHELFILIPNKNKIKLDLSSAVHVQSTGGGKFLQFFSLLSLGRKIIRNSGVEEITTQDPFFTGLVGAILKFLTGKKLEVQLHGDFFSSDYYRESGLGNLACYWLARLVVLGRTDRLRVVGERIRESLLKLGIKDEKIKIKPIEDLVVFWGEQYKRIKKQQADNKNITCVRSDYSNYKKIFIWGGRMEPVKNLEFLIDVFQEVAKTKSDWLLLLIGEGSQDKQLKSRIEKLGLKDDNIQFIHWVRSLIVYIHEADCVLFPSLSEGYGRLAMEAHAAGTPIIMSDVGVANYELKPSDKVKILPINDKEKWVQAILSV